MSGIHTREEMYDLVWSTPMRTLAKRFGISDVALRKRCVKAAVPTPPSGYWTQLRVGCAPARPSLPPRPLGMSCVVGPAAHRHSAATTLEEDIEARLAPDEDWSPDRLRKRLRAEFAAYPTTTRGRLHPLIRARLDRDEVLRKRAGRCRRQLLFDGPIFDSPFERRRLNLLNRLFLTCEAAGAKPSLSGRRANEISVTINHVTLHLLLADQAEIRRGHNAYPLELPAGNATLTLAILRGRCGPRWHRSWQDTKGNRLEVRIPTVATELFVLADERYREGLAGDNSRRDAGRAAREREARLRAEEAERARRAEAEAVERARIERLLAEARAHHDAQLVRSYVDHLRATSPQKDRAAFDQWADWALTVADRRLEPSDIGP